MENAPSNESMERLISTEERERLQRALGSFGLYDASQDSYNVTEHPEDRKWPVELDSNPDIILSIN